VYDKLLKPRQSFLITLYILKKRPSSKYMYMTCLNKLPTFRRFVVPSLSGSSLYVTFKIKDITIFQNVRNYTFDAKA